MLKCKQVGDVTAIEVKETMLDAECAEQFKDQLRQHAEGNRKVLLDLRRVSFADSSGLGAILTCLHGLAKAGGSARVCGLRPLVHEMFHLLRLDRIVDIHRTAEEALLAFGSERVAT